MSDSKNNFDLIVIGAGPGGYVAAIRAAQLGMSVACVDENAALGGTCLRVGCIPSKALLESSQRFYETNNELKEHGVNVSSPKLELGTMLKRKDKVVKALTSGIASLFKKNKIQPIQGRASVLGDGKVKVKAQAGEKILQAKNIILAAGSVSASLPGIDLNDDRIDTSTDALSYDKVPKHLVVIGAGFIGMELGSVWNRLGAKVTVVEYLDRILPAADSDIAKDAFKIFKKQGINFKLGKKVASVKSMKSKAIVEIEGDDPIDCDRVLMSVGRKPNTQELGLEEVNIKLDDKGQVEVDENYKTSANGIYAIGDIISGPMLAHKAEEEGVACVEKIATGVGHVNYNAIPSVAYTHPEIASVGKTEDRLKEEGKEYTKGEFPFIANGRARALGDTDGKVKILADKETDRVLGVHILGSRAGDMIAQCTAALEFGASSEDIARTCHAHPTLSEAVKEAALAVDSRALHI